jgi:hypothetical protein
MPTRTSGRGACLWPRMASCSTTRLVRPAETPPAESSPSGHFSGVAIVAQAVRSGCQRHLGAVGGCVCFTPSCSGSERGSGGRGRSVQRDWHASTPATVAALSGIGRALGANDAPTAGYLMSLSAVRRLCCARCCAGNSADVPHFDTKAKGVRCVAVLRAHAAAGPRQRGV